MSGSKKRKQEKNIDSVKRTHQSVNPDSYYTKYPNWRFKRVFLNHRWAIDLDNGNRFIKSILPKLISYETQTWQEIVGTPKGRGDGSKSHSVSIVNLCQEAQKLLQDNNIYIDDLFSLRLTGKERVWGILENGVLDIIWYDSDHEICPVNK